MTSRPATGGPARASRRVGAVLLPALLAVLLAAGCSVRVVDADAPASDGQATPPDAGATPAGADASEDDVDDLPDAEGPAAPTDGALLDRAALGTSVTRTGACGDDVAVDQAGAGVAFTGDCGTLTVAGAGARVVAGHVDHLVVEGGGAQVVVASVDRVTLEAASVRVAWESGDPQVTSSGADAAYGPVGTVRLATD